MANYLMKQQLLAELATLDQLLAGLAPEDILGRIGLQSRRTEVASEITQIQEHPETAASIALLFGGKPVLGSMGIEAAFASEAVSKFQDLLSNVWATAEGVGIGSRGPVPAQERSQLHITSLLHGSVGFLLEELHPEKPLFSSSLKLAADRATEILEAFGSEDEQRFTAILETVDQRVLNSTRDFFRQIYRSDATIRLAEAEKSMEMQRDVISRAYQRAENVTIEDSETEVRGQLLGLIPIGRKFEMRDEEGNLISGSVAPTLSESYLQRLTEEDLVGKRCVGRVRRKKVSRFGRISESVTLLDLTSEVSE
jgi:hypothetical protein